MNTSLRGKWLVLNSSLIANGFVILFLVAVLWGEELLKAVLGE